MTSGDYFRTSEGATPDPAFPPRLVGGEGLPSVPLAEGVRFRPVFGDRMLLNYVTFEPFSEAPLHSHSEEQVGTVLEGELEFELAGERRTMRPGDTWVVPPHVPHAARTGESGCLAIDVFSPPRAGVRELLERAERGESG